MKKKIAVLPGDGIGPEVTRQAVRVLEAIAERFNYKFKFEEGLIGAVAIDKKGNPFPKETHELCNSADAILFGAIGDPKYDKDPKATVRPEQGLLAMRKALGLYANIRPVTTYKSLEKFSPLRTKKISGVDFVVYRELTGGIYFGEKGRDHNKAFDTCVYSREEILRVAKLAFQAAMNRRKKLTLVDKANVMETSRLWRETVMELSRQYPKVELECMFVDNAAMQLILNPKQFDVILTENMFGDILTDEASVISGSLGLLPSASVGDKKALFEPIHGSYPQAKGKNIANPVGAILSAAMLLDIAFGLEEEAAYIVKAVKNTLNKGFVTKDLSRKKYYTTTEIGDKIVDYVCQEVIETV